MSDSKWIFEEIAKGREEAYYATKVASVSSGLLGFRSISREESAALQRVAREMAEAHAEAARTITESASVDTLPV